MKRVLLFFFFFTISAKLCLANVSVVGALSREKTVEPGERFEGIILLKNKGEGPYEVRAYQTDYLFSADGKSIYGDPGSTPRSNATWLSLRPNRLTIPPKETASVYYTVQVPDRTDLNGTYWSIVMIEPMAETSLDGVEEGKVGLRTVVRYGFQIIVHIGDTGARKIRFLDKQLISQDEKKTFQMDIENIGERMLAPFVWVELYNKDGMTMGRFESRKKRIYPSCSVRHKVDLTDVPTGKYKALVIIDNGDESVFGAQYELEIDQ